MTQRQMDPLDLPAQRVVLGTTELVELISLQLTLADLSKCLQVDRRWNNVFAPLLWHTVDDKKLLKFDQNAPRAERTKIVDEIRTRFKKHGHHIRVLQAHWDIVIEAASVSCNHLIALHLMPRFNCKLNKPDTWAAHLGASKAAETARARAAMDKAKEEARRAAGIEAYCVSRIAAATTPEEAERFSALFSDEESRTQAMASFEHRFQLRTFLSTFTFDDQKNKEAPVIREIRKLPGDLGVQNIDNNMERLELDWMLLQDCWRLIAVNLGLQVLKLERMPAFQEKEASREFVHDVLAGLKDLRELSVPPSLMDSVDFWSINTFAPRLESLTVRADCFGPLSSSGPQQEGTISSSEKTVRGLKSLQLSVDGPNEVGIDFRKQIELTTIQLLLKRLPDLESLSLKGGVDKALTNTPDASLEQTPSTPQHHNTSGLQKLYFPGSPSQIVSLLPLLPNLVELQIKNMTKEIVAALVKHCKKIEAISYANDPWFIEDASMGRAPSAGISNLLVHLPALKSLNMIEQYLHVNDLEQKPWACLGLENFRCRIVGIERLSGPQQEAYNRITSPGYSVDLTEDELEVLEQFNRCQRQQRCVYDRLASLTKLKVLDLGYEWRYPWTHRNGESYVVDGEEYLWYEDPIPDTMEFSLASGLDRLSALKDLEMFGFEGNDHRIGEKELDWMAEKWPKLKLMYGLAEDKLMSIEYDLKKAALRKYMQRLKPEVVHDSLFLNDI
ncbi:hypothetical protein EMPS_01488 [Entomortierella parvispora]|uniref:F-box domain-containing protein n=1 Tax=Entomortierella parvispora TaxID=205924 RepID=A0A9P3LSU9_9FUNG|nr:hypothetical protein EMPS_01488 [Entomortierella parvispora]